MTVINFLLGWQGSSNPMQGQNFGAVPAGGGSATNQAPASGAAAGGAPAQPRQRVRARRGQATDPHSIAERVLITVFVSDFNSWLHLIACLGVLKMEPNNFRLSLLVNNTLVH